MKEKIAKTNVARLLDKAKIAYELIPYQVDENDLSAVHVAASLGENIEQVFMRESRKSNAVASCAGSLPSGREL